MAIEFRVVKRNITNVNIIQKYVHRHFFQSTCKHNQVYLKVKNKKNDDDDAGKRECVDITEENQYDKLTEFVTPLLGKDYQQQLKTKWIWSRSVLNEFASSRMKKQCYIEDTIPSPVREAYRNKSEFNVRTGADGNPKTVGTFIGSPALGETICIPPTHLVNTPQSHKDICRLYQEFIRSSPLPACHSFKDGGFWKGILVRSNLKGETMLCVGVNPREKSDKEIQENASKLLEFFESKKEEAPLTSLLYQPCPHTRCTNETAPYQLLSGQGHLIENLAGYQFRISPDSFFQINVGAAELLYEAVLRLANLKPYTTLLDLCCGTGTISLLASSKARFCIGIDSVAQAIKDAKENKSLNSVENCEFAKGRIEGVMRKILKRLDDSSDICVVLNPGRVGMHPDFIKEVRSFLQINRLIYISCKADAPSMLKNFNNLCNTKFCKSPPFNITRMVPVDLFPQTNNCELVLLFER